MRFADNLLRRYFELKRHGAASRMLILWTMLSVSVSVSIAERSPLHAQPPPALPSATAPAKSDLAASSDAPPRLIVRGDDMGFSHAGNEAILHCFRAGIETTIEVIVPAPWFPEAVTMLAKHIEVDVGVHLTLTSEWDLIKWRPVTPVPSLQDANGYFYPMIFPNEHYPRRSLRENAWKLSDIEREFRGQIELAQRAIPRVSHLTGHMGCEHLSDEVRALYRKLAKEYRLDIVSEELGVKSVTYRGPHTSSAQKVDSFMRMLDSLEPNQTYLFVDHPGLNVPELRAIHHVGYEDVAADRQGVTDTWTDPRIRQHIKALGIQLISYRDLRR